MNKPVLMIHEVRDWMFKLPLKDYILTFDDGLYSQYYYLDKFKKIPTEKIFFISTGIVAEESVTQNQEFPPCQEAHKRFFKCGDTSNYMKWSQVKEIYNSENCFIGGHSHEHKSYENLNLTQLHKALTSDTKKMLEVFKKQSLKVEHFCYPYNRQYPLYEGILKAQSFISFYGKERLCIETLNLREINKN